MVITTIMVIKAVHSPFCCCKLKREHHPVMVQCSSTGSHTLLLQNEPYHCCPPQTQWPWCQGSKISTVPSVYSGKGGHCDGVVIASYSDGDGDDSNNGNNSDDACLPTHIPHNHVHWFVVELLHIKTHCRCNPSEIIAMLWCCKNDCRRNRTYGGGGGGDFAYDNGLCRGNGETFVVTVDESMMG